MKNMNLLIILCLVFVFETGGGNLGSCTVVDTYVYHAESSQTDSTPFITASNYSINKESPYSDRIIAVSRDLLELYPFGSKVYIEIPDHEYTGTYTVQDLMNKRYTKSIDILIDKGMPLLREKNIQICLLKK